MLLGAALFALYYFVNDDPAPQNPTTIDIDETILAGLAKTYQRVWMRAPSAEEMSSLIDGYIKEEILYREGLALGLDKNDLIIRRRMQQKVEFLNADLVELAPATDAELQKYLDEHADKYRQPEVISFKQIFIRTSEPGSDPENRAGKILAGVTGKHPDNRELIFLGDSSMLPQRMKSESQAGIGRVFGEKFAAQIADAPLTAWSGPYASGYGLHLVYISERIAGRNLTLSEARMPVERDLTAERTRTANDQFYQALRKRYVVKVQYPRASANKQC